MLGGDRAGRCDHNRFVVDALAFEDEIELLVRLRGVIETERCQIGEPAVLRCKSVADDARGLSHGATSSASSLTRWCRALSAGW